MEEKIPVPGSTLEMARKGSIEMGSKSIQSQLGEIGLVLVEDED